jgi:predicted enzyme related to lactoylglutathione lyase
MGKNPVVHFEIAGKDFGKLKEFYGGIFGWEIKDWKGSSKYGMVEHSGEGTIGGGMMQVPEGTPPFITFYIQVDDLKGYLEKIIAAGGQTITPPQVLPDIGSAAIFRDPDGNVIGLFCEKQEL